MFCAISGNVPEQPVVSTKSGALFEKRLIEKYVRETGKCPVTQETLTPEDLLPVRISKTVKARTAPASSIPGLLSLFHDEWDATMLEMHSLRQSLSSARQELSHALYQHDAACRVIGRLIKERDDARTALENYKPIAAAAAAAAAEAQSAAAPTAAAAAEEAPAKKAKKAGTLPDEVVSELTSCNVALSGARKKRQMPEGLATAEQIAGGRLIASNPVHKTTTSIVAVDSEPGNSKVVATGGSDTTVRILDTGSERLLATLEGHRKRLTGVQFLTPGVLVSSSADTTARVWRRDGDAGAYTCAATLKEKAEIVGVTAHPSRKYFVTASGDGSWSFYDAATASLLRQVVDVPGCGEPFTAVCFHPDGLLLGTGTSEKVAGGKSQAASSKSIIRLWEVMSQSNVASFEGLMGPVHALSFSENGYHLATASDDGVQLWDLRKLRNFKTLQPYEASGSKERSACRTVAFDYSGQFLAVGGADARIYGLKQDWSVVKSYPDLPEKGVNALHWQGRDAKTLLVGSADHNLRSFGVVAEAADANSMQE